MDIKTDILKRLRAKKGEVERRYHGKHKSAFLAHTPVESRGGEVILTSWWTFMTVLISLISPDKKIYLEETFQTRVDVISARALRKELTTAVLADVKYV